MKKLNFSFTKESDHLFEYIIPTTFSDQKVKYNKSFKKIHDTIINEDNLYFYLSIIEALSNGKKVYGIPCWDVVPFILKSGYSFDLVSWQCSMEYMHNLKANDINLADYGVKKATTTPLDPPYPKWDNSYNNSSAIFKLKRHKDFIDLISSVKDDIYGEINLFGLNSTQRKDDLIETLNQKKKPSVSDILENCDFIIDLVFGMEKEYQDCIIIKSKTDVTSTILSTISSFNEHQIRYEEDIDMILKTQENIRTDESQKLTA